MNIELTEKEIKTLKDILNQIQVPVSISKTVIIPLLDKLEVEK